MDPNATLARIRELIAPDAVIGHDEGAELAELVANLDGWITGGGFLPLAWQSGDVAALGHPQAGYTRSVTYRTNPIF